MQFRKKFIRSMGILAVLGILGRRHDAVVVLRMLKKVFRRDAIAGGLGVARKCLVFLEYLDRIAADAPAWTVRIETVVSRIRTAVAAVSTAATSLRVVALSHSSFTSACTDQLALRQCVRRPAHTRVRPIGPLRAEVRCGS